MANTALTVFLSLSIVLLFAVMILSSIAANNADSNSKCHSYSMYSALTTGVVTLLLIIGMGVYIYTSRHDIAKSGADYLSSLVPPDAA